MSFLGGFGDFMLGAANTAWDIFAQKKTWDREDSAIQRRVADLRKAGLSPTLAAGSAAQTSSPINVSSLPSITGLMRSNQDIAQSKAQVKLVQNQEENARLDNYIKRFDANVIEKIKRVEGPNGLTGEDIMAFTKLQNIQAGAAEAQARALEADAAARLRKTQSEDAERNLNMARREGVRTNLPGGNLGLGLGIGEFANHFLGAFMEQLKRAEGAKR